MQNYARDIVAVLGPEPKPCKRFRRVPSSDRFMAHWPKCPDCRAVIEYLRLDASLRLYMHMHRN